MRQKQIMVAGGALRRIGLALLVAALMAAMLVIMAAPAFAVGGGKEPNRGTHGELDFGTHGDHNRGNPDIGVHDRGGHGEDDQGTHGEFDHGVGNNL